MNSLPLIAWLVAGICFIFSLGGLSRHETSRRGNWLGIIGMVLAVLAAFAFRGAQTEVVGEKEVQILGIAGYSLLLIALVGGSVVGAMLAKRVEMTAMPQLVAILHIDDSPDRNRVGCVDWRIDVHRFGSRLGQAGGAV